MVDEKPYTTISCRVWFFKTESYDDQNGFGKGYAYGYCFSLAFEHRKCTYVYGARRNFV